MKLKRLTCTSNNKALKYNNGDHDIWKSYMPTKQHGDNPQKFHEKIGKWIRGW